MQRISGKNFDISIGDLAITVNKTTLTIEDKTEVAKDGGVPNGFVDGEVSASGDMELDALAMNAILEKIRGKFGATLNVKESDLLKKAFGSDEAVSLIKLLYNDTTALKKNIADIGRINNMDHAKTMAKSMTDIWARLGGAWDVLRITFAQRMLPTIEKVTDKIVGFIHYIQKCMDIAPGLTGKLGLIVAGAIALAGVMGVLGLVVAANKLAFLGLTTIGGPVITVFKMIGMAIRANPIGFLIWSLAMCVLYWTDVRAAIGAVWDKLLGFLGGLGPIGQGLVGFFQKIAQWWNDLTTALTNGQWTKAFMQILDAIMGALEFDHKAGHYHSPSSLTLLNSQAVSFSGVSTT